jgi:tRNA-specific 2-thiouridylase
MRALNWLGDGDPDALGPDGIELFARVRSTRPPRPARLFVDNGEACVDLAAGETGVAAGQACVLYDGDGPDARVLGGGFIARSERASATEAQLARLDGSHGGLAAAM